MNTFWTEQQIKVHRLINNSQGLQKVMVKDFPVKYYSMKCFTFWEDINTIINSQYREQLIYYEHLLWHCINIGGFSRYFLPTLMTDWA